MNWEGCEGSGRGPFKLLFQYLPAGTEDTYKNMRIVGLLGDIGLNATLLSCAASTAKFYSFERDWKIIMNCERISTWKEAVLDCFVYLKMLFNCTGYVCNINEISDHGRSADKDLVGGGYGRLSRRY
jgi:hypothetical protein